MSPQGGSLPGGGPGRAGWMVSELYEPEGGCPFEDSRVPHSSLSPYEVTVTLLGV